MKPEIKRSCHSKKLNYRHLFLALAFLTTCSTLILWFEEISNHLSNIDLRQLPQNEMSDTLFTNFEHLQLIRTDIRTITKSETGGNREGQSDWHKHEIQISSQKNQQSKEDDHFSEGKYISLVKNPQQYTLSNTLKNIDKCMSKSNLMSPALLEIARENAKWFMEQYGRVISPQYLDGYVNYCWNTNYEVTLNGDYFEGHIGEYHFKNKPPLWFEQRMKASIKKDFKGKFSSSTVCLPNIYLLGFAKCGTTFFQCFLSKILNGDKKAQAIKEPYFWTPFDYKIHQPNSSNIGGHYVPMFLKGFKENVSTQERRELASIDATPITVLRWPRFTSEEPELTNYCLLPSALPELFPQSKYLVIMREPVSMMYSAFWWSLYHPPKTDKLSQYVKSNLTKGREIFHQQSVYMITQFLKCINSHQTVRTAENCTLLDNEGNFSACISNRKHLLPECVQNITIKEGQHIEAVIFKGIYYVYVQKWLQTVPRERIFFTAMERLTEHTHSVAKELSNFFGKVSQDEVERIKQKCRKKFNKNPINYTSSSLTIKESTKTILQKFFQPFNRMLSELLEDEQFLWRQKW